MQNMALKGLCCSSHCTATCFVLKDCVDSWRLAAAGILGGHGAFGTCGLLVDTG